MPEAPVPHIYDVPFPKTHLLYFDVYADKLCQLITQYLRQADRAREETDDVPGKHAFVVGIHGPWGSGKSTLMRMLGRKVEQAVEKARGEAGKRGGEVEPILRIKFQAWRYSRRETLWRALLSRLVGMVAQTLQDRLEQDMDGSDADEGELTRLLEICTQVEDALYRDYEASRAEAAARSAAFGGFMVGAGEAGLEKSARDVEGLRRERAREYHRRIRDLDRLQERFRELRRGSGHKWLIEIDDLDRCLPEEAIELFEATKVFLDVPGVVFVVALDRQTIRRGLELRYEERAGDLRVVDPDLYVEKVTNISFVLPNLSDPANVKQLIREADASRMDGFGDEEQRKSVEKLMLDLLEHQDRHVQPNPRRWIRLLNTALLYSRMRKPLEIELIKHGFSRRLLRLGLEDEEVETAVGDLPKLLGASGKGLEELPREDRYRLWTLLQNLHTRADWDAYVQDRRRPPRVSAWEPAEADRTFLKVLCISYRWGGFMEAALNSWEVMVTFEHAASQAERNFERFRELCTARYPALRAYAEDPDLFQLLLSKPQIAHPRPPDFILEMF